MPVRGLHAQNASSGRHPARMFRDDFDRHLTVQLGVKGAIDFAHTSLADLGDHPKVRDRYHHRFRAASQLTTTVMGAGAELSGAVEMLLTRNRFPSAATS